METLNNEKEEYFDNLVKTKDLFVLTENIKTRIDEVYKYHSYVFIDKCNNDYIVREAFKNESFIPSLSDEIKINIDSLEMPSKSNFAYIDDQIDLNLWMKYLNNFDLSKEIYNLASTYYKHFKNKKNKNIDEHILFFINDIKRINNKYGLDIEMIRTNSDLLYFEYNNTVAGLYNNISDYIYSLSIKTQIPLLDIYSEICDILYGWDEEYHFDIINDYIEDGIIQTLLNSILKRCVNDDYSNSK